MGFFARYSSVGKLWIVLVLLAVAGFSGWSWYQPKQDGDRVVRTATPGAETENLDVKSDIYLWKSDFYLEDITFGAGNAPVEISYFFSLTCPACKKFHQQVMPAIMADLVGTGLVKMTWIGFPTDSTSMTLEIVARYQASRDQYLKAIKFVYSDEADTRSGKLLVASLRDWREASDGVTVNGRSGGLKRVGKKVHDFIAAKRTEIARKLGVQAVPTLIINGKIYKGAINYAAIAAYVKKLARERGK